MTIFTAALATINYMEILVEMIFMVAMATIFS